MVVGERAFHNKLFHKIKQAVLITTCYERLQTFLKGIYREKAFELTPKIKYFNYLPGIIMDKQTKIFRCIYLFYDGSKRCDVKFMIIEQKQKKNSRAGKKYDPKKNLKRH